MDRNGASVSVNSMEKSIIEAAPFETIFSQIFLILEKCRNTPFDRDISQAINKKRYLNSIFTTKATSR
jgi:hypothetical protein